MGVASSVLSQDLDDEDEDSSQTNRSIRAFRASALKAFSDPIFPTASPIPPMEEQEDEEEDDEEPRAAEISSPQKPAIIKKASAAVATPPRKHFRADELFTQEENDEHEENQKRVVLESERQNRIDDLDRERAQNSNLSAEEQARTASIDLKTSVMNAKTQKNIQESLNIDSDSRFHTLEAEAQRRIDEEHELERIRQKEASDKSINQQKLELDHLLKEKERLDREMKIIENARKNAEAQSKADAEKATAAQKEELAKKRANLEEDGKLKQEEIELLRLQTENAKKELESAKRAAEEAKKQFEQQQEFKILQATLVHQQAVLSAQTQAVIQASLENSLREIENARNKAASQKALEDAQFQVDTKKLETSTILEMQQLQKSGELEIKKTIDAAAVLKKREEEEYERNKKYLESLEKANTELLDREKEAQTKLDVALVRNEAAIREADLKNRSSLIQSANNLDLNRLKLQKQYIEAGQKLQANFEEVEMKKKIYVLEHQVLEAEASGVNAEQEVERKKKELEAYKARLEAEHDSAIDPMTGLPNVIAKSTDAEIVALRSQWKTAKDVRVAALKANSQKLSEANSQTIMNIEYQSESQTGQFLQTTINNKTILLNMMKRINEIAENENILNTELVEQSSRKIQDNAVFQKIQEETKRENDKRLLKQEQDRRVAQKKFQKIKEKNQQIPEVEEEEEEKEQEDEEEDENDIIKQFKNLKESPQDQEMGEDEEEANADDTPDEILKFLKNKEQQVDDDDDDIGVEESEEPLPPNDDDDVMDTDVQELNDNPQDQQENPVELSDFEKDIDTAEAEPENFDQVEQEEPKELAYVDEKPVQDDSVVEYQQDVPENISEVPDLPEESEEVKIVPEEDSEVKEEVNLEGQAEPAIEISNSEQSVAEYQNEIDQGVEAGDDAALLSFEEFEAEHKPPFFENTPSPDLNPNPNPDNVTAYNDEVMNEAPPAPNNKRKTDSLEDVTADNTESRDWIRRKVIDRKIRKLEPEQEEQQEQPQPQPQPSKQQKKTRQESSFQFQAPFQWKPLPRSQQQSQQQPQISDLPSQKTKAKNTNIKSVVSTPGISSSSSSKKKGKVLPGAEPPITEVPSSSEFVMNERPNLPSAQQPAEIPVNNLFSSFKPGNVPEPEPMKADISEQLNKFEQSGPTPKPSSTKKKKKPDFTTVSAAAAPQTAPTITPQQPNLHPEAEKSETSPSGNTDANEDISSETSVINNPIPDEQEPQQQPQQDEMLEHRELGSAEIDMLDEGSPPASGQNEPPVVVAEPQGEEAYVNNDIELTDAVAEQGPVFRWSTPTEGLVQAPESPASKKKKSPKKKVEQSEDVKTNLDKAKDKYSDLAKPRYMTRSWAKKHGGVFVAAPEDPEDDNDLDKDVSHYTLMDLSIQDHSEEWGLRPTLWEQCVHQNIFKSSDSDVKKIIFSMDYEKRDEEEKTAFPDGLPKLTLIIHDEKSPSFSDQDQQEPSNKKSMNVHLFLKKGDSQISDGDVYADLNTQWTDLPANRLGLDVFIPDGLTEAHIIYSIMDIVTEFLVY